MSKAVVNSNKSSVVGLWHPHALVYVSVYITKLCLTVCHSWIRKLKVEYNFDVIAKPNPPDL